MGFMLSLGMQLGNQLKAGGAALALLAANGGVGLALASLDDSMSIVDLSTPANNYQGTPGAKLTTTRASTATYWDTNGVLQSAANNVLRRDFDPRLSTTVERCGYLIEEARTNLALRSEALDDVAYTKLNASVTANAIAAPDGATTADKLSVDTTNGNHRTTQAITVSNTTVYTASVFAKAGEYSWIDIETHGTFAAYFDLTLGVVGTVVGSGATAAIVNCGNGWYRCSLTYTSNSTAANFRIYIASNGSTVSFAGANTTDGLYLWGHQLEAGPFATSYIPTTTATVTRAADLVTLAGTLFPLNTSVGTLYSKFASMGGANPQYALALDDGTTGEINYCYRSAAGLAVYSMNDGGVDQIGSNITSVGTLAILTQGKIAGGYTLNDSAAALIGETVKSDNVCTMPTPTKIVFGNRSSDSARALNGWLFEAAYFPTRRTNSQLQTLASGYASDALLLMGAETQGLTFSASDQSMSILDTVTPANNYSGDLASKLGTVRASNAYYYNSAGLLALNSSGTLRLDYDSRLTGGPGYLVEEARTNLALRSQEFDNASWTAANTTVSANASTAPDGTTTADRIGATLDNTTTGVAQNFTGTAAQYTLSVYLKRVGGSNFARLALTENTAPQSAWFNLATGAVATVGAGVDSTSIQSVGNGWYRCTMTCTCAAVSETAFIRTAKADNNASGDIVDVIDVWGAQVELGAFATSYIPTTTASVTRAVDIPLLAGTAFPINSTEGTLVFKGLTAYASTTTAQYFGALSDGTGAEAVFAILCNGAAGPKMQFQVQDNGSAQCAIVSSASVSVLTQYSQAGAYKANDMAVVQAGEAVQTDATGNMPTLSQFNFGQRADGLRALNGWLRHGRYYPRRATNTELATLAAAA